MDTGAFVGFKIYVSVGLCLIFGSWNCYYVNGKMWINNFVNKFECWLFSAVSFLSFYFISRGVKISQRL